MYIKNTLQRDILITVEEVLFHAPTKHTVDPRMIESSIIVAEERLLRTELGDLLYEDLIAMKNREVTAANLTVMQGLMAGVQEGDVINALEFLDDKYKKLWKQHLWKLSAECVIACAYPEGFVQFGSEGTFHNSPPAGLMVTSGQVTPLISSMKWSLDKKMQDRISPLIQSMHGWICRNYTTNGYVLYDKRRCPDDCNPEIGAKNAGIALNMYDEDEDDTCCGRTGGIVG